MIDHDDIQAEENRRREVAVKAGASALATKYEDSPYKRLIRDVVEESSPAVEPEFKELLKNDPKPGYNFVSTPTATLNAEQIIEHNKELIKQAQEADKTQQDLMKEAAENELKVTKTSTGQPKVDASGNVVEPLQGDSDTNPSASRTVKADTKNPSPIGSGDARASNSSTADKDSGSAVTGKK